LPSPLLNIINRRTAIAGSATNSQSGSSENSIMEIQYFPADD
jgi:hypothetical protein